jgi:hypothetical protein
MTRTGKIARLPRAVREQLNRRLRDGEQGKRLVAWLKSLPEVQSVLAAEFSGRTLSEQNLSEWKQGGYREWLVHQEAVERASELAASAEELTGAAGALADHLAVVLTARYAAALAEWDGNPESGISRKLRVLRALCQDVVELRRGDHSAARLKIEQAHADREKQQTEEEVFQYFRRWAANPKVRASICGDCVTAEEREERMRQAFGLASQDENNHESNPIQPNQT